MIKITNIEEIKKYFNIPEEAVEFIKGATVDTENKRYDFGEKCFINVQNVSTACETPLMEAHEIFVDVQYLISGEEKIFYTAKEGLPIQRPYSEKGDGAFYDFDENSESVCYKAGEAVVLYPEEAHLPNRAVGEPMAIKKAVIKVAVSLSI